MNRRTAVFGAILALAAGLLVAVRFAGGRWERTTEDVRARMRMSSTALPVLAAAELPAVVRRYLEQAVPDGRAPVRLARVRHEGEFRMSDAEDSWVPFTSSQLVTTAPPGFDWDARIRMAPGLPVYVRDGYVLGIGVMRAAVFGLWTVARVAPTPELAEGQLLRYLAETPWYPTALLPGQGVSWLGLTDRSARAFLENAGVRAELDFHFGSDGMVESVEARGRGRAVDGAIVQTPWAGRVWDYEVRHGLRVPLQGEVEWRIDGKPMPYWRGRITDVVYE
jgi:hypothetical protein